MVCIKELVVRLVKCWATCQVRQATMLRKNFAQQNCSKDFVAYLTRALELELNKKLTLNDFEKWPMVKLGERLSHLLYTGYES